MLPEREKKKQEETVLPWFWGTVDVVTCIDLGLSLITAQEISPRETSEKAEWRFSKAAVV